MTDAFFAEIDENNLVLRVLVIPREQSERGQDYLANDLDLGGRWIQTCPKTLHNIHSGGGTPLRKNYAGAEYTYDVERDAFIPPKPYPSWILDEQICDWTSPVPHPTAFGFWIWDEESLSWKD